jgi:hypothetical protein
MDRAGLEVRHYRGRFFWQGPAVVVSDRDQAISATDVACRWDQMGLDWIVYPQAYAAATPAADRELEGRTIRLVRCEDSHTHLRPGLTGVVTLIDGAGTLHILRQDGHRLGLIPGIERGRWWMPDRTSSWAGNSQQRPDSHAEVHSTPSGLGDSVVIPLRPAGTSKARRPPRARTLSPLWSEVASVLARARPADPDTAWTNSERRSADTEQEGGMSEAKVGLIYIRQSRHKYSERTVNPEVQEEACRALPAIQACDRVEVYVDL